MAIFNCCDGLGLAQQLSDLHLPQVIVMREPVADKVAQDFLKYFLHAFASGQHLYMAVRQARERLQGMENEVPCASRLLVLCQNPAVTPPRWIDLSGISDCPYKGLSAFREEDKSIFFGRFDFIQRLLEALKNKPQVTVIGASGSGKSSVVFAGLIPHWRSLSTAQLSRQIAHFRPENNPFKNLAAALIPLLYPEKSEIDRQFAFLELELHLESCVNGLYNTIQTIVRQGGGSRLLLVVDQCEELYTLTPEEKRQPFVNALLYAVNKDTPRFNCVLTLRADFLGRALDYEPLGKTLQKYSPELLIPMTDAQLEFAIAQPALTLEVQLAEGLTKRIINDYKHLGIYRCWSLP